MQPAADIDAAIATRRARVLVPWGVALAFGAVLDQLTKQWAELYVRPRGIVTLIPDWLDLRYVRNPGAFFSLGAELEPGLRRVLLCAASALVLGLIVRLYVRVSAQGALARWGLALLAGGAVGNLIDRVLSGEVVDFVHLHYGGVLRWATFNLADVVITLGLCLLALDMLRPRVAGDGYARTATDGGT